MHRDADLGSFYERLSLEPHFAALVLGKIFPAWIHTLYQSNLLLTAPSFDLFFACDGNLYVLVAFVVHEAMALVFLTKAFNRIVLVLMDASCKKARDSDVERTGAAGENVDPKLVMKSIAHARESIARGMGRIPRICMAEDASSGSLHSPRSPAVRDPSDSVEMTWPEPVSGRTLPR